MSWVVYEVCMQNVHISRMYRVENEMFHVRVYFPYERIAFNMVIDSETGFQTPVSR